MNSPLLHSHSRNGAALVVTLLIVALITTILVTYVQLVDSEKGSSMAVANRYRASLAADAGIAMAQAQVTSLFQEYPDSAIGWAKLDNAVGTDASGPETSVFYFRATDNKGYNPATGLQKSNAATPATKDPFLFAWPLVSGANWVQISAFTGANSVFSKESPVDKLSGLTANNSININQENWIGTPLENPPPSPTPPPPPIRARWVEVLQDPAKPKNPDPSTPGFNPPIARFAYYIEDESFKVNLNTVDATSAGRGDDTPGQSTDEGILQAILPPNLSSDIDKIRSYFLPKPLPAPPAKARANIPTVGTIDLAASATATTAENNKFILTTQSSALDQSRGGALRLNLNEVVQVVDITDPDSADEIRLQLDRIIAAIDNQYAMPDFGERFFRTSSVTNNATYLSNINDREVKDNNLDLNGVSYKNIYNFRIAANIRDYLDSDSMPTIMASGSDDATKKQKIILGIPDRTLGNPDPSGANNPVESDTIAIGKESVPLISEYAMRVYLKRLDPPIVPSPVGPGANFDFDVYHYIELHNPTNKPIRISDLGSNSFIKIYNLFNWDVGGGTITPTEHNPVKIYFKDFKRRSDGVSFSNYSIPANGYAVISTESSSAISTNPFSSYCNVEDFFYSDDTFVTNFKGITKLNDDDPDDKTPPIQNLYQISSLSGAVDSRAGSSNGSYDCEIQILIGSDLGLIESCPAVALNSSGRLFKIFVRQPPYENAINSKNYFTRSSIANSSKEKYADAYTTGDLRSHNEELEIKRYSPSSEDDKYQTRFADGQSENGVKSEDSKGPEGNTTFLSKNSNLESNKWVDYTDFNFAIYSQLDSQISSVGQLGDIFDPVKVMTSFDKEKIPRVRHGGRTLKIGQTEKYDATLNKFGLWDGQENSASRNWTAWRLADVFSNKFPIEDTNKDGKIDAKDGFAGYDRLQTEGVININGVPRDGGLALRTALQGFQFTKDATGLGGRTVSDTELDTIITTVLEHLQNNAPLDPSEYRLFWERGQLSELMYREGADWKPFFSTGNKLGTNMATVYDRAKEELFRRCVELICTKGNTFTVYSVGQTLNPLSGKVVATSRKKQTFRIIPDYTILDVNGKPVLDGDGKPLSLPNDEDFDPAQKDSDPDKDSNQRRGEDRFRRPTSYSIVKLSEQNE
jgi:hypothetical protein